MHLEKQIKVNRQREKVTYSKMFLVPTGGAASESTPNALASISNPAETSEQ